MKKIMLQFETNSTASHIVTFALQTWKWLALSSIGRPSMPWLGRFGHWNSDKVGVPGGLTPGAPGGRAGWPGVPEVGKDGKPPVAPGGWFQGSLWTGGSDGRCCVVWPRPPVGGKTFMGSPPPPAPKISITFKHHFRQEIFYICFEQTWRAGKCSLW